MAKCHLYVIGPRGGPLKIGITDDVRTRRSALNIGNPLYLRVFHQEEFATESEAKRWERELHHHFRESHIRGEWFALKEEDVAKIRQLCASLLRYFDSDLGDWSLERKACDEFTPEVCARARRALDWDQTTLARNAGLTPATVKNFEADSSVPHLETIEALRAALEDGGVEFVSESSAAPLRVLL